MKQPSPSSTSASFQLTLSLLEPEYHWGASLVQCLLLCMSGCKCQGTGPKKKKHAHPIISPQAAVLKLMLSRRPSHPQCFAPNRQLHVARCIGWRRVVTQCFGYVYHCKGASPGSNSNSQTVQTSTIFLCESAFISCKLLVTRQE